MGKKPTIETEIIILGMCALDHGLDQFRTGNIFT